MAACSKLSKGERWATPKEKLDADHAPILEVDEGLGVHALLIDPGGFTLRIELRRTEFGLHVVPRETETTIRVPQRIRPSDELLEAARRLGFEVELH